MSGKSPIQWTEATGRKLGRLKQVSRQIGVTLDEYIRHRENGEKWCIGCHAWHSVSAFVVDKSRADGYSASCAAYRNTFYRARYAPKGRPWRRGWLAPTRDGDVRQARRRVNYLVEQGRIPHPNRLLCADCGHVWRKGLRRHEYDHYHGYAAEHQIDVQPVCSACHHRREAERRAA